VSSNLGDRLDRVYSARDLDDLQQAYDQWARSYDEEVSRLGYLLRTVSVGYIARYIDPERHILDAGAGTGLIGGYLQVLGYHDITAIDLSEGMLKRARNRGCYRACHQMVLGERLNFDDDAFDAAYAVGVFTEGHAPPNAFEELTRIVRPGGRFVFSIRDDVYRTRGYRESQDELENAGHWRKIAASPTFRPYPDTKPELESRVFVYEIA
jgi:SAM-dependent methyltransferase